MTDRWRRKRTLRVVWGTRVAADCRWATVAAPNVTGVEPKRLDNRMRKRRPPKVGLTIKRRDWLTNAPLAELEGLVAQAPTQCRGQRARADAADAPSASASSVRTTD